MNTRNNFITESSICLVCIFTVFFKIKSDNELIECTVDTSYSRCLHLFDYANARQTLSPPNINQSHIRKYLVNALHNIQFAHHKSFLTQDMAFYIASINPIILNVKSVTFSTKITV